MLVIMHYLYIYLIAYNLYFRKIGCGNSDNRKYRPMEQFAVMEESQPINLNFEKVDFLVFDNKNNCLTVGKVEDLTEKEIQMKLEISLNKVYQSDFFEKYE